MADASPAEDTPAPVSAAGQSPRHAMRRARLRLTVAIPLVVTFLVMLSGFLALWISYPLLFRSSSTMSAAAVELRVVLSFATVGLFAVVSLLVAGVLARSIARPLRDFASRVHSLRPAGDTPQASRADESELRALDTAIGGVEDSLKFESYTLRSLGGGVVTVSQQGTVTSFNTAAEQILGAKSGEVRGRAFAQIVADDPANETFVNSLREALHRSVRKSSAEALVHTRGGRSVHLGYSISPLKEETGRPLGIVLTFKDLAKHKAAEQTARRRDNLVLVGTMAANVAHEVQNPLAAIRGLVETIRETSPPDSAAHRYAPRLLKAIDRISRVCRELLTVGNPEPREVKPVDINNLARETLDFCRYDRDIKNKDVEVRTTFASELPPIPGDVERLGQVLLNIVRNAFHACEDHGEIAVATRATDKGVAIDVRNTGSVIPPEVLDKLFTLFFTTKKRGTGLGLCISQQLVRAHGGQILVESTADQGTIFTIELPLVGASASSEG